MAVSSYGDLNSNSVTRAWAPLSKVLWVDVLRIAETGGWKHYIGQVNPTYYSIPRFRTGFLGYGGGDVRIKRIRPVFTVPESSTVTPIVTVIHRWIRRPGQKPSEEVGKATWTSDVEVSFRTPISEISEIEIEYELKERVR